MQYSVVSTPLAATPIITPKGGSFSGSQMVTIADATPGATIYYTLDGGSPQGDTGQVYTGPFSVTTSLRVYADAVAAGYTTSSLATVVYGAK